MSYLIDTDVLVGYLKGRAKETTLLDTHAADTLAISIITYGEVYEGIYFGAEPKKQEQGFLAVLRAIQVVPLNKPIMKRFARIRGELRRTGNMIPEPDILIAATALHYNLTLITWNRRHFDRVPDLILYRTVL